MWFFIFKFNVDDKSSFRTSKITIFREKIWVETKIETNMIQSLHAMRVESYMYPISKSPSRDFSPITARKKLLTFETANREITEIRCTR
jgi:hypothetical protein